MIRPDGRAADVLRPVTLETKVAKHAEGSCLVIDGGDPRPLHRQRGGARAAFLPATRARGG
jgi:hypothetical protein